MEYRIQASIEVLRRTPGALRGLLAGLGDEWTHANYGEGTFSPFDVVGHLIHGERVDWIARARIILSEGESRPFDPFDRYAQFEESRGRSMAELLDEFEALRAANLETLQGWNLSAAQMELRGTHPELGTVTLAQLLATWVVHDLNHVAQICKALSHQYREAVGPWRAYLSVLKR